MEIGRMDAKGTRSIASELTRIGAELSKQLDKEVSLRETRESVASQPFELDEVEGIIREFVFSHNYFVSSPTPLFFSSEKYSPSLFTLTHILHKNVIICHVLIDSAANTEMRVLIDQERTKITQNFAESVQCAHWKCPDTHLFVLFLGGDF